MAKMEQETEGKIRDLGRILKLYHDFMAAADFSREEDLQKMGYYGNAGARLAYRLADELNLKGGDDVEILEEIVRYAEDRGSDAADGIKAELPKVHAVENVMRSIDKDAPLDEKTRAIHKALKP